jgi:hypothetical protein
MVKIKSGRIKILKSDLTKISLLILLFILFVLYIYVSTKIIWVLYLVLLVLILLSKMKFTGKPVDLYLLLILPLSWGLLMSFNDDMYHAVQGFFYLSIPLIMIMIGFQMYRVFTIRQYFLFILITGNLIGLLYIVATIAKAGFGAFLSPYTEARFAVGSGTPACVLSLIIALYSKRFGITIFKNKSGRFLSILINLTALYLFASRTYWVMLILFIIIFSLKTMKKDRLILLAAFSASVLLIVTAVIKTRSGLSFENSILFKFANSFTEIKVRDFSSYSEINTYFRGYEAYRSWITFKEGSFWELIFGGGYGKIISLGTKILLDGKYWSEVPWVHNGIFYVLVKQGITGVIFSLLFFLVIFNTGIKNYFNRDPEKQFLSLVLLSCSVSMFITNFVDNAMYSLEMTIMLITIGYVVQGLKPESKMKKISYQPE